VDADVNETLYNLQRTISSQTMQPVVSKDQKPKNDNLVNIARRQLELKTLNELVDSLGKKQSIRKNSSRALSRKQSDAEPIVKRPSPSIQEIIQHQKEQHRLSKESSGQQSAGVKNLNLAKKQWSDFNTQSHGIVQ
jgi:hypothetical protein